MIPRQHRLKHKRDFTTLFEEGQFVGGALFTMKVWKIDPEKYARREYKADDLKIGFVVSTKVQKSAVKRNRMKRHMREAVRLLLKESRVARGYFVALIAKPELFGAAFEDVQAHVRKSFQKAGLLT